MEMIGRTSLFAFLFFGMTSTLAVADARLSAEVDRNVVSLDETVRFTLQLELDGDQKGSHPTYRIPDFDVVNEFSANQVHSFYDNGQVGTKVTHTLTKVLRPLKTGNFVIGEIKAVVDGQTLTAPNISIQVLAQTAGQNSQGGSRNQQRGTEAFDDKRLRGKNPITVRLDVDKKQVYKGEQVIASYYLFRQGRVSGVQVDKFPEFKGFLKEDLDLPFTGSRLEEEQVIVNGIIYLRALLAKYLISPIKEGRLTIDQLGLRAQYFPSGGRGGNNFDDEDDPFGGAFNFFSQMQPRLVTSKSEPLTLDVVPLPTEGRPSNFGGGVGKFTASAALDKVDLKANEAMTLTLLIEGKGNANAFTEPKLALPPEIESYESKSRSKIAKDGSTEKVFEFLLIPRKPGQYVIPSVTLSFFNPATKAYEVTQTEPLTVRVGEGQAGAATSFQGTVKRENAEGGPAQEAPKKVLVPRPLKGDQEAVGKKSGYERGLLGVIVFAFFVVFGSLMSLVLKKGLVGQLRGSAVRKRVKNQDWGKLQKSVEAEKDVSKAYEQISGQTYDLIDRYFAVGARSHDRGVLRSLLVDEKGVSPLVWDRLSALLEYAETARFALKTGVISEQEAKKKCIDWILQLEAIDMELQKSYK